MILCRIETIEMSPKSKHIYIPLSVPEMSIQGMSNWIYLLSLSALSSSITVTCPDIRFTHNNRFTLRYRTSNRNKQAMSQPAENLTVHQCRHNVRRDRKTYESQLKDLRLLEKDARQRSSIGQKQPHFLAIRLQQRLEYVRNFEEMEEKARTNPIVLKK